MVRPSIARADSSTHNRQAPSENSAGLDSGFLSISVRVAACRSRTSRGRTGRSAVRIGTTRRFRIAVGGLGIGGAPSTRYRLRSGMARPALFFWSCRLGTFERDAQSECARVGTAAVESNRALPARESTGVGEAYAVEFCDRTFDREPNPLRGAAKRWRVVLLGTCAA